jgi:hypothetical protein
MVIEGARIPDGPSLAMDLTRGLSTFEEASDHLLQSRMLQQRVDRKYLLPQRLVPLWLGGLPHDYRIVRFADEAVARYETRYFDTSERQMYHDHRRGRRPRCKVRIRHHLNRRCTFVEVKVKETNDRTMKARTELPFGQCELDAEARRFIDACCPIRAHRLAPCLSITFFRVTLVGVDLDERVTFDWGLEFHDRTWSKSVAGVVIVEIKQARYSSVHGAARALRALNVREQAVSKYCLATTRLTPVRMNTFKPAFRAVERLVRWDGC